jgi:hypothetical protein
VDSITKQQIIILLTVIIIIIAILLGNKVYQDWQIKIAGIPPEAPSNLVGCTTLHHNIFVGIPLRNTEW